MPRSYFTQEQIDQLRINRYVRNVTPSTVSFTEEFKILFYRKYQEGYPVRLIFLDCGINPDILGKKRIDGFCYLLRKNAQREGGFKSRNHGRPRSNLTHQPKDEGESMETTVQRLEHELAYTRQEVEFLKKLQMADMEARKQWESKHRQK